jgi:hypothetical protein
MALTASHALLPGKRSRPAAALGDALYDVTRFAGCKVCRYFALSGTRWLPDWTRQWISVYRSLPVTVSPIFRPLQRCGEKSYVPRQRRAFAADHSGRLVKTTPLSSLGAKYPRRVAHIFASTEAGQGWLSVIDGRLSPNAPRKAVQRGRK